MKSNNLSALYIFILFMALSHINGLGQRTSPYTKNNSSADEITNPVEDFGVGGHKTWASGHIKKEHLTNNSGFPLPSVSCTYGWSGDVWQGLYIFVTCSWYLVKLQRKACFRQCKAKWTYFDALNFDTSEHHTATVKMLPQRDVQNWLT